MTQHDRGPSIKLRTVNLKIGPTNLRSTFKKRVSGSTSLGELSICPRVRDEGNLTQWLSRLPNGTAGSPSRLSLSSVADTPDLRHSHTCPLRLLQCCYSFIFVNVYFTHYKILP